MSGPFPEPRKPGLGPTTHTDDCMCVRCAGFPHDNQLAVTHGAYARVKLAPRAAEHAAAIGMVVPASTPGDRFAIAGLGLVVARIEAVSVALDTLDGDDPLAQFRDGVGERIRHDARAWLRLALRYCEALALTPQTRARLAIEAAEATAAAREQSLDLARLDDTEVHALRRLVAKASGKEEGP